MNKTQKLEQHLNIVGLITILILSLTVALLVSKDLSRSGFSSLPATSQVGAVVMATTSSSVGDLARQVTRQLRSAKFGIERGDTSYTKAVIDNLMYTSCQLRDLLQVPCSMDPVVTSVTPSAGPIGTRVSLKGSGFSSPTDIIFVSATNAGGKINGEFHVSVKPVGGTLSFIIPEVVSNWSEIQGTTTSTKVVPGKYYVVVQTPNDKSYPVWFTVSTGTTPVLNSISYFGARGGNPPLQIMTKGLYFGKAPLARITGKGGYDQKVSPISFGGDGMSAVFLAPTSTTASTSYSISIIDSTYAGGRESNFLDTIIR